MVQKHETAAELAAVLRGACETHGTPGAVAGVLVDGETFVATHGVTNVEYPTPVSPACLFQVGSITKTFTSAAVAMLVQEGRLAFEDPLHRHIPDLGSVTGLDTGAITIEHLLSHQSGFDGDHFLVEGTQDGFGALSKALRLFDPGTGFSYNNAGFSLAGAVVEAVSGEPFERFVRDRLLIPLGMRGAGFRADEVITYQVAAPHVVWGFGGRAGPSTDEALTVKPADPRVLERSGGGGAAFVIRGLGWQAGWELDPIDHAAGGLVASVEHLLAWSHFQRTGEARDGSILLRRDTLDRLHTPVVRANRDETIALDWLVSDIDGAPAIDHGGVTAGYVSDLLVLPRHDFAFVGLTNATNGASANQEVRRWALRELVGLTETDPAPDPAFTPARDRYCGRFHDSFAELVVTAGTEPNTLVITPTARTDTNGWQPPLDPPVTCAFVDAEHVVTLDAPGPARLVRFAPGDGEEPAQWLLWGLRRALRTAT